ncbi:GT-D fold domain-containing glycosyltransferase [Bacillus sp. DX1.1]|uniref:GT-D fold domain-containing protein n=1 Tax=unclassified Bacillus (in: firmicutes) TaxID=185979 RepID=UPI00256FBB9E|nr:MULTISPECIES: GT-D fold domain-containing glycosyltransferase [unclassified Bacillus (in: firmicutes)]MDM5153858.1 GT-D fold domain-containing glycosyltransferase [Bacillus sp. DX1.1]WJE82793.1 GT-D fold domain-containing glycosyltransferase [Bacillus sp. DX3.1]
MSCNCHSYQHKFLSTYEVLALLEEAVNKKEAFSLTRFSHAEISCLSWKFNRKIFNIMNDFRSYNGFTESIEPTARKVLKSMKTTNVAGFIRQDCENQGEFWYENTKKLFHHLHYIPKKICSVWITHEMIEEQKFWELLREKKIALIGRRAQEAIPYFQKNHVNVTIALPLEGTQHIKELHEYLAKNNDWNIALLAAGIPATILTPMLANSTGRIAIDFGHALDMVIDGHSFNFSEIFKQWKN